MPPEFSENGQPRRHPLEELFKAPGWDILSAVAQGHRARTDVKGKLAEFYLNRHLEARRASLKIDRLNWSDATGEPDFIIEIGGVSYKIECKNVRSGMAVFRDGYKVEIQKTRNAIQGGPSRGYRKDEFDILAACLFNQTGQSSMGWVAMQKHFGSYGEWKQECRRSGY
ncbi:MAG: hypothetical protein KGM43_19130 [Planctomycetota bacterium]|nr:hypothetical protein [Planctomycetota bacterium]